MRKNLELYVHTPFCVKKCDYCDFLSFQGDDATQENYVKALIAEILFFGPKMREYEVSTIYIGGGTPSWLDENLLLAVLGAIYQSFSVRQDAEITVECNPGTVTKEKLTSYLEAGINRLSLGLQSTLDEELRILGRIHTYEQFLKTYEMARAVGFGNINVDLISGLPGQNYESFGQSLNSVIRLRPEHISVYSLSIEKGTPFYDKYKFDMVRQQAGMPTEILPNEEEAYRIYKYTQMQLVEAGYEHYEISNYAKSGFACRHNLGYWRRENYLGLGLGAASLMENVRYANTRNLEEYLENAFILQEIPWRNYAAEIEDFPRCEGMWLANSIHAEAMPVTRKAQMEEFMFLGLRITEGVSRMEFENAFHISIEAIYKPQMEELKRQGLLVAREGRIFLTDKGMDLANYCMGKFLL